MEENLQVFLNLSDNELIYALCARFLNRNCPGRYGAPVLIGGIYALSQQLPSNFGGIIGDSCAQLLSLLLYGNAYFLWFAGHYDYGAMISCSMTYPNALMKSS